MKDFRAIWKQNKEHTAEDHIAMCVLKALNAKNNAGADEIVYGLLVRTFTPVTNKVKLTNGMRKYHGLWAALVSLQWKLKFSVSLTTNGWKPMMDKVELFGLTADKLFNNDEEFLTFKNYVVDMDIFYLLKRLNRQYCYVFVDTSVTPEQQMVQAAHVTMVVGKNMNETINPHEVFYQIVERPKEISAKALEKNHRNFKFYHFVEPDLENKIIASAIHPVRWDKKKEFEKYPLVLFELQKEVA